MDNPNFRIIRYPRGYVVEIQKEKGWLVKRKYWTHYISVSGIASEPWYFSSEDAAMDSLLRKIKWNALENNLA